MSITEQDPLITRLRAADPDPDPGLGRGADDPQPDRPRLERALQRRSGRRRRGFAITAPALGACAAAAFALAPAGSPGLAQVLDRATAATAPPPNAIVVIRSRIEGRFWSQENGRTGLSRDETGVVRLNGEGKPLDVRTLQTRRWSSEDGNGRPGAEDVTHYAVAGEVAGAESQRYDPATGKTVTERNSASVPRLAFDAHRLLAAARSGRTDARLEGEATIGGHRTYRLVIANLDGESAVPGIEDRTELYVDTTTYEAVEYRTSSKGRAQIAGRQGPAFTSETTQRVLSWQQLPDTPANRRLLQLRGPLEP